MADNLNQSSKAMVLALLNRDNASAFTEADLKFGSPEVETGATNTKLKLQAAVGSEKYKGQVTIHYNRLDLAADFADPSAISMTLTGNETVKADLLTSVNTTFGLALEASDFTDASDALPEITEVTPVTLSAASDCLAWINDLTVQVSPNPA